MFNDNTPYMFQQRSPSLRSRTSNDSQQVFALDNNGSQMSFLRHNSDDVLSGHYLASNAYPYFEASNLFTSQDVSGDVNGYSSSMANTSERKQAGKKDRHSKIYTSQGPRDRRVRLSIGISRKFFDLQEMLGFDKPSKTLDWLLTKSKSAIKDLVQKSQEEGCNTSHGKIVSNTSASECEVLSSLQDEAFELGNNADSTKKSEVKCKGAVTKDPHKIAAANLVKESRVKARARARERTREKMSIKQLSNGVMNTSCSDMNVSHTIPASQYWPVINPRACEPSVYCSLGSEGFAQESIVIKKKMKHPTSAFGYYQQNFDILRDMSAVSYDMPPSNAAENWDFSGFTSQSSLCSILDQHKFMNN